MEILNNIIIAWFIGIFLIYVAANKTNWFNSLQKEQRWYYALGWPIFLPYYLYLRYKDRN